MTLRAARDPMPLHSSPIASAAAPITPRDITSPRMTILDPALVLHIRPAATAGHSVVCSETAKPASARDSESILTIASLARGSNWMKPASCSATPQLKITGTWQPTRDSRALLLAPAKSWAPACPPHPRAAHLHALRLPQTWTPTAFRSDSLTVASEKDRCSTSIRTTRLLTRCTTRLAFNGTCQEIGWWRPTTSESKAAGCRLSETLLRP